MIYKDKAMIFSFCINDLYLKSDKNSWKLEF